jgi:hypothetical protein
MYFQRSKGILSSGAKDIFGVSFLDLIFGCISKLETVGSSGQDDVEFVVLLKLLIFLIENCYQEILPSQQLYDAVFQILARYLSVDNRGDLVKMNALQLMCIMLYLGPEVFINATHRLNQKEQLFFTLFGQLDLFEQYKQKDDLLLGIVGLFRLHETQFPDVIPMSSLMREAYNCVKSICKNKSQQCANSEGDSQDTRPSEGPFDEEDLAEEDEDDDEWNEEVYFQEELNYEYESPFQNVDPITEFENGMKVIEKQNPMYFKRIISELAPAERNELNNIIAFAKQLQVSVNK